MKIDWNIAPDATHYDKRKGVIPAFMRKAPDGLGWEFRQTNGGWMYYGELTDEQAAKLKKRPAPWTGEGPPPVGTVCEFTAKDGGGWISVEVKYLSGVTCVLRPLAPHGEFDELVVHPQAAIFRPIRTPEQIAAEERKAEILGMIDTFGTDTVIWGRDAVMEICAHLWEAGYRKQVKPMVFCVRPGCCMCNEVTAAKCISRGGEVKR